MRPFTILDADQRSDEWRQARVGLLTGSVAADMLATNKDGSMNYKRRDLLARLVCERLTGQAQENSFVSDAMQRGIDKEPDARAAYEAKTGNLVRQTGFLRHTSLMVGCSLDGDVDDFTGIVELKCPKSATHLGYLECRDLPTMHRPQVLHNLWVSGAHWCDFVSFDDRFPEELQLYIVRLARTPALEIEIGAYAMVAEKFLRDIDDKVGRLRGLVAA